MSNNELDKSVETPKTVKESSKGHGIVIGILGADSWSRSREMAICSIGRTELRQRSDADAGRDASADHQAQRIDHRAACSSVCRPSMKNSKTAQRRRRHRRQAGAQRSREAS